jgi:hypothetical protein
VKRKTEKKMFVMPWTSRRTSRKESLFSNV